MNSDGISELLANKNSTSTVKSIQKSAALFREYLSKNYDHDLHGISPDQFETLPTETLDRELGQFYASLRSKTGQLLKHSTMNSLRYGISKYLKDKGVDIMGNAEFGPSKNIFMAVQADLKKKSLGSTDHIPPISRRDLTKIYNTAFDVDTAVGLQMKVWFDITFFLCRRGRENLREMTTSTFAIAENSSGRRYLYQAVDEMDKNHRVANTEETVGEARMYSTSGPMCPIATWLKYLSKLQPDYSCLWQKSMRGLY